MVLCTEIGKYNFPMHNMFPIIYLSRHSTQLNKSRGKLGRTGKRKNDIFRSQCQILIARVLKHCCFFAINYVVQKCHDGYGFMTACTLPILFDLYDNLQRGRNLILVQVRLV